MSDCECTFKIFSVCPSCGGGEERMTSERQYVIGRGEVTRIVCDNCLTTGPAKKNLVEAIRAWNDMPRERISLNDFAGRNP